MIKEKYEQAEVEIIELWDDDVLITSSCEYDEECEYETPRVP